MTTLEPLVRLEEVGKSFATKGRVNDVLRDVSFSLGKSEVVGIIGASGTGKTTLLNLLAGEDKPSTGSVRWFDDGRLLNSCRIRSPMVFQDDAVFPWMTVQENVLFSASLRHGRKTEEKQKLAALFLERLGLGDCAHSWPSALSGGMRKRVELARAVFSEPKAILLDEPFNMLDPVMREDVRNWFMRELTLRKIAAVLVTHDIREALKLCDRVLLLSGKPASVTQEFPGLRGHASNLNLLDQYERDILLSLSQGS